MYNEMLSFVEGLLEGKQGGKSENKKSINYNRFYHIKRVFKWVKYLCDELDVDFDRENLYIAAIFHDAGYYNQQDLKNHAIYSAQVCEEYLLKNTTFEKLKIQKITSLISNHSDKSLLYKEGTSKEMIILLEADLLDDTGAMGLVIDTLIMSKKEENPTFESIIEKMKNHTFKTMKECPMVTSVGKSLWNQKLECTKLFIDEFELDIKD